MKLHTKYLTHTQKDKLYTKLKFPWLEYLRTILQASLRIPSEFKKKIQSTSIFDRLYHHRLHFNVARADQESVKALCQYRLAMGSIKVATR